MTHDDLEFSISQYLDGTLAEPARTRLEERLATDAEARALFEDHQALDRLLKSAPLPQFDWDQLHADISNTIAEEETPVFTYPMPWVRHAAKLAMAASVVIAALVGLELSHAPAPVQGVQTVAVIEGPKMEVAAGPAVIEVALEPAPADDEAWRLAEVVVSRPSRVIIASGEPVEYDNSMPY